MTGIPTAPIEKPRDETVEEFKYQYFARYLFGLSERPVMFTTADTVDLHVRLTHLLQAGNDPSQGKGIASFSKT